MSLERAAVQRKKHRWRRRWYGVCVLLCAIAVFTTTYALILPAITEETPVYCGLEEHSHGAECYRVEHICGVESAEEAHLHSEACAVTELILRCTEQEMEGHSHDPSCYTQQKVLTCNSEEAEHIHDEMCYALSEELVCLIPETEGHFHNELCYESQTTYVCGLAEVHIHTVVCYQMEQALCCILEEDANHTHGLNCYEYREILTCDMETAHTHSEACLLQVLDCVLEEHIHDLHCYSNPSADLEVQAIWEKTLPASTGDRISDILAIAKSQLGYQESEQNYIVSAGGTKKGYSRYGQWYGDAYGDWCAMFASFCLRYAGYEDVPIHSNCQRWVEKLTEKSLYMPAGVYTPRGGDIIFFDLDGDATADHVGLVSEVAESIWTIEGNTGNAVKTRRYDWDDTTVMGYGVLSQVDGMLSEKALEGTYQEIGTTSNFTTHVNNTTTTHIRLTANMTISTNYTLPSNKNLTIDLNGYVLTHSGSSAMFTVGSGRTLTIWDSQQPLETVTVADVENHYGNTATLSGKTLTYYVTTTKVVDPALGATEEEVQRHVITAAGGIYTNKQQPLVSVKGGTFNLEGGMLYGDGNTETFEKRAINMESGTTNLNNGYICGFGLPYTGTMNVDGQFGGAVYMTGGTMNIVGSVIAANTASSAGAIFSKGGTINIGETGEKVGIISGNQALSARDAGSGVNRYNGGGGIYAYNTKINMTAGYLTNNFIVQYTGPYCDDNGGEWSGGGGIMMEGTSEMDFCGGYVTGNFCDGGGGIRTTLKGKSYLRMYHLIDENGTILSSPFVTANATRAAEGAGISLGSAADNSTSGATITGGYVTNNIVLKTNHWGGGGIFCSNGGTLHIEDALIVNNSAGGFGGGMAGCSTGHMYLYMKHGCAIYDNVDEVYDDSPHYAQSAKNDDVDHCEKYPAFFEYGHCDYFCALESVITGDMLGGGSANWEGSADGGHVVGAGKDTVVTATYVMGLQSHASEEDKLAAQAEAKLYINGNHSYTHGGGILCNGILSVGVAEPVEVPVSFEPDATKKLVDSEGNEVPLDDYEFHFAITDHLGNEISHGVTDKTGKIIFDQPLILREAGTSTFYILELEQAGYPSVHTDTALYRLQTTVVKGADEPLSDGGVKCNLKLTGVVLEKRNEQGEWVTIHSETNANHIGSIVLSMFNGTPAFTNVLMEYTNIQVQKVWKDNNTQAVTVRLYRDDVLVDTQTLNSGNGWSYSWSDMPLGDGTRKYTYRVEEDTVAGYVAEYYSGFSSGMTYWVPATSLTLGREYIITNSNGDQALMLTSDHANANLTSNDRTSVTRKSGTLTLSGSNYTTWYEGEMDASAVFVVEATSNASYVTFKNKAMDSWLSATNSALKGTTTKSSCAAFSISSNLLKVSNGSNWTNSTRYNVRYSNSKFSTSSYSSTNAAKVYEKVTTGGDGLIFTIVNTPVASTKYEIHLEKVSEKDGRGLEGAKFQVLDSNGNALRFTTSGNGIYTLSTANTAVSELVTSTGGRMILTGLTAGNYTLRETEAPVGHLLMEDYQLTLGEGSSGTSISLRLVDPIFAYSLPETGGSGTTMYIVVGLVLLLTGSALLFQKRRREAVENS